MADTPAPTDSPAYTIDELAANTGVPSRTIRFYQSKGALPPPERRGRVAYYGTAHIERLELIAKLQDRGLRLRAIRDLLTRADRGELRLDEWLGLEGQLTAPWSDVQPQLLGEEQLREMVQGNRPGLIGELEEAGFVVREGHSFLIRNPALVHIALQLERAGVSFDVATHSWEILRDHLGRAANQLVSYFAARIGEGFGRGQSPEEVNKAMLALRPLGLEATKLIFAGEVERAIAEAIQSGELTRAAMKKRR
jgi:DNA-binding transcriptional MerR regulator